MNTIDTVRPIRDDASYRAAQAARAQYLAKEPEPGTDAADHADLLTLVINDYEARENPNREPATMIEGEMHNPRQCIHFVAATELVLNGQLSAQTVELLVLLAPQPMTQFQPPESGFTHGTLTVAFAGAGAAMHKSVPIDAAADAMSGGKVQVAAEDEITKELANAMRVRLAKLIDERNRAVSAHMKRIGARNALSSEARKKLQ